MSQLPPGNDPIYKRLYAFREMVEDLLRSLFPADVLAAVDLPSLRKLPAEYVGRLQVDAALAGLTTSADMRATNLIFIDILTI